MFGFNLRSLAEAAINTLTGISQSDEEIAKLVKEAEKQDSSFRQVHGILRKVIMSSNLTSMTKELEKQLVSFADANSSILKHMEHLNDGNGKKGLSVDIWGKASRFYYSIGAIKEQVYPEVVRSGFPCLLQNEKLMGIRAEIAQRSETLHDIQGRVSAYNKKQSMITDVREEI